MEFRGLKKHLTTVNIHARNVPLNNRREKIAHKMKILLIGKC